MWNTDDYFLHGGDPEILGNFAYDRACRVDFTAPGFALLDLGEDCDSRRKRQIMIDLKKRLDHQHVQRGGKRLGYASMSRFDQQVTTKPHRDGGPAESLLMLGYEPTPVRSKVALSDYTQCAFDMGITPAQFLDSHNPMYVNGQRALEPYTTILEPFRNDGFQILLLNNSSLAFDPGQPNLLGVLHTAEILNPMPDQRRVVNSTMIFPLAEGEAEPVSEADLQEFLNTELVRKPVYG